MIEKWDYFAKDTVGKQWIRASDSIAANISEGFGRYTSKDSKKFYIIARGSMQETKTWLVIALRRKLISETEYKNFLNDWDIINFKLISFLKSHIKLMSNK